MCCKPIPTLRRERRTSYSFACACGVYSVEICLLHICHVCTDLDSVVHTPAKRGIVQEVTGNELAPAKVNSSVLKLLVKI